MGISGVIGRCLLWALMVLASFGLVPANGTVAADLVSPGSAPPVEAPIPAFKPTLDLSLGAGKLPSVQTIRPVPAIAARDTSEASPRSVEKPLTFGFDVRTRHRVGDEIRADAAAPPSLGNQVRSTIDRSTFGVTGTYRF